MTLTPHGTASARDRRPAVPGPPRRPRGSGDDVHARVGDEHRAPAHADGGVA